MRDRKANYLYVVLICVIFIGGCCDSYKKQIDQLTLEKRDLEAQLKRVQSELDEKQLELVNYQNELSNLQDKLASLESELTKARQIQLPAGWRKTKEGMIMTSIEDTVLFDPGKAELKRTAKSKLDSIIKQINENFPGQQIYIVGHTDSDPIRKSSWKDNLELSLHRAAAVARYMIANGLDPKHVVVAGVGEHRPVVPNTTQENKARNRRVEFWLLQPVK